MQFFYLRKKRVKNLHQRTIFPPAAVEDAKIIIVIYYSPAKIILYFCVSIKTFNYL